MNRDQAKDEAKRRLPDYLRNRGIDPAKNFSCLNPSHRDETPSMGYDRKNHRVNCFGCGESYDVFDLVAMDGGLKIGSREAFDATYELFGIRIDEGISSSSSRGRRDPFPLIGEGKAPARKKEAENGPREGEADYRAYFAECAARLDRCDYLKTRGISTETAKRYGIGYDPAYPVGGGKTWRALIVPTGAGSYTARNMDPGAAPKDRYRKKGAAGLYMADELKAPGGPIVIVEGELDALSVVEAGGRAVALGSTANVRRLLSVIETDPPESALIVALDNDEAGANAAETLLEGAESVCAVSRSSTLYGAAKDASEALREDREGFMARLSALADQYDPETLAKEAYAGEYCTAARLEEIFESFDRGEPPTSTGFRDLDAVLDGGLYAGLYVIGAISSLGKTTFALQAADHIAAEGEKDVLVFSLEMARAELVAKSLSRLTMLDAAKDSLSDIAALSSREVMRGDWLDRLGPDKCDRIEQAQGEYRERIAPRMYVVEGLGRVGPREVRKAVARHTACTGAAPVVIVDYLQILAGEDPRASDKQNTDAAVTELKRISRDFSIPVIAISSFNRANYDNPVGMQAFKESGAIEYSADCLLGLQFEGQGTKGFSADKAKGENPRRIEVAILKNRNGIAGRRVALDYYPRANYYAPGISRAIGWNDPIK